MRAPAKNPLIDGRSREELLASMQQRLAGYLPGWQMPDQDGPAKALLEVFARHLYAFAKDLNQVPERNFLAFLDALGLSLLPGTAARVPLVFQLLPDSPADVTLPAGSQAAAPARPAQPSPLDPPGAQPPSEPAVFATENTVTLTRSHLAALYSLDPANDRVADHSEQLEHGFTLFEGMELVQHEIYLGHDTLFALAGDISVILLFSLSAPAGQVLKLSWEYLSDDGWLPFVSHDAEDTTQSLRRENGQIVLRRECGPNAMQGTYMDQNSYWIRGRLVTPLLSDDPDGGRTVPVFDTIRTRVSFTKSDVLPEAAYFDTTPLDLSKPFQPFGPAPVPNNTFYLASREAFQHPNARIRLSFQIQSPPLAADRTTPGLIWEYYNGKRWTGLAIDPGSYDFQSSNTIAFTRPVDWSEASVNGARNYWLRARLVSGDYGLPLRYDPTTEKLLASSLHPPTVSEVTLSYTQITEPVALDHCLARNNFVFEDHSAACQWPNRPFRPFQMLEDEQAAVYFGFDRALPAGLMSLYWQADSSNWGRAGTDGSPFVWEYRSAGGWTELGMLDETRGFQTSGMIQWIGAPDAVAVPGPHGNLYRLRARLKRGEPVTPAQAAGAWFNAVWAAHRRTFTQELLGAGSGEPGQTVFFPTGHTPVLEDERVEVCEWRGEGLVWESIVAGVPPEDVRYERNPADGSVRAVWVHWMARPTLYGAGPQERCYLIERANGWLRFGDGQTGKIPPAGARLAASYRAGGGLGGNLPPNSVRELRTAVPLIAGVTNPVAASGGALPERLESVSRRGPQVLRRRGRAVSASDYEWLARQASPAVARTCCLSLAGPDGYAQRGWVTLAIAPYGSEPQPQPSAGLLNQVQDYLKRNSPASAAGQVRVTGVRYVPLSVQAEVTPTNPGEAALVEARLRQALNRFLHPLLGGPEGQGWDFGQAVHLSQIYTLIEQTPGVDYARQVSLRTGGHWTGDSVPVDQYSLLAAGQHELKLFLRGSENAAAFA